MICSEKMSQSKANLQKTSDEGSNNVWNALAWVGAEIYCMANTLFYHILS